MKTSVFETGERLHKIVKERNTLQRRLAEAEARVLVMLDIHKAQIRRSLESTDPEERRAAESIAEWYGVRRPSGTRAQ